MLGGECSACCGDGWVCVECETITPSGYSTETFSDGCWYYYVGTDGSTNPLTFSTGCASRCLAINNDGDLSITITASLANEPERGASVHVAIGSSPGAFCPFNLAGYTYAVSGFAIGKGSQGSPGEDRIQHFAGDGLVGFADGDFTGTLSATFSRRSGVWYVSTPGLGESPFQFNLPASGVLFHGVQGTNDKKVFSGYSVTVS